MAEFPSKLTPPGTPFKRCRPSPSGATPQQRRKSCRRTPLRPAGPSGPCPRTLSYSPTRDPSPVQLQEEEHRTGTSSCVDLAAWTVAEMRALVEFLLFYTPNNEWPGTSKKLKLWSSAAKFVYQRTGSQQQRSGLK